MKTITRKQLLENMHALKGCQIISILRGHGTALLIDMASSLQLSSQKSIWTLMTAGEWRIKKDDTLIIDSKTQDYKRIDSLIPQLLHKRIMNYTLSLSLQECSFAFDNALILEVYEYSYGGWSLRKGHNSSWFVVENGTISISP